MKTKPIAFALAAAYLTLLGMTPARLQAATLLVTCTADSGPGSLREALASATGGDTIDATGVAGTITLTSGQLLVSSDLIILGPGASTLTVSGNSASRVFEITGASVTIRGLTIASGSSAQSGAGIMIRSSSGSTVHLIQCAVTGNSTTLNGGGIYNSADVTLQLDECLIAGNSASGSGGGIFNDNGIVNVFQSTLSSNTANLGGGIYNEGASYWGFLNVEHSTLNDNSASFGGGVYLRCGSSGSATGRFGGSTFSNNAAGGGGAIQVDGAWGGTSAVGINASTFRGNSSPSGAIVIDARFGGSASLGIGDTVLEAGASGVNLLNDSGLVTSYGHNLCSDGGGALLTHATDLIHTDPLLGPLQDNGGPTFTHSLLSGSPAIDAGKHDAVSGFSSYRDQRGLPRPFDDPAIANASGGDGSDIGAFELSPPLTVSRLRARLNFAKRDADSFSFRATLDPGAGFDPSGQEFSLDFAGATETFILDEKGRGATERGVLPAAKIRLALNRKTGLWDLRVKFKRGCWCDPWGLRGLVNGDVPKPGQAVTMPLIVRVGNQGFVDLCPLIYTSRADRSGTAM